MFKRVRQLRIPLAAKCELLFGAAVILVIGAALLVPWQRMEDLTEQLNEKAAAMVARHAIGEHVIRHSTRTAPPPPPAAHPSTAPATQPGGDATASAGRATMIDGQSYAQPRLVPVSAGETARNVTRFELSALSRFQKDPTLRFHAPVTIALSGAILHAFAAAEAARALPLGTDTAAFLRGFRAALLMNAALAAIAAVLALLRGKTPAGERAGHPRRERRRSGTP